MGKTKYVLACAAIVSLSGSTIFSQPASAAAHNPLIVWQGGATILTLTAPCSAKGWEVGDEFVSVYRPNLDPAEPKTGLTLIAHRHALSFFRNTGPNQMAGAGTYTGSFIGARATGVAGGTAGSYSLTITPNPVTTATVNVTIAGSLSNLGGIAGCTLGFRGVYTRRP